MKLTFSRFTHRALRHFHVFSSAHFLILAIVAAVLVAQASAQVVDDPNLKQAIRETLNLPDEIPLTQQEMSRLTNLDAEERGITDLTGLEYATNIRSLRLDNNPIVDISLLVHLTKLEGVHLTGCQIVDLSPLRNLKNLRGVFLGHNQISDISALAELTNLTYLHLQSNQIVDLSPLANLINLREFWIQDNSVEDITILANLTQLTILRLDNNQIRDISPLTHLTQLEELHIADNPFYDFSPLLELEGLGLDIEINEGVNIVVEVPDPNLKQLIREALSLPEAVPLTQGQILRLTRLDAGGDRGITNLTGLEYATNIRSLRLHRNPIVDISPLAHLTKLEGVHLLGCDIVDLSPLRNLKNLRGVFLGHNQISDISPLAELTNLTALHLQSNQIVDLGTLANLINLRELWLNDNLVEDIAIFTNLMQLTVLRLDNNQIRDISPLAHLTQLEELHIADNPFYDFSPLLELERVELDIEISEGFDVVVEIPDPNLRLLIREALSLPEAVPLTQGQMLRLTRLDAGGDRGITNLMGLEYATNIRFLVLYRNPIVDISFLIHLTKLEGVNLWGCNIVDLSPLRNLKNLKGVFLGRNKISDISPLGELTNLTALHLHSNQIVDFSPLANLINLRELWIQDNLDTDISPLQGLNIPDFRYDEVCDIEPLLPLVRERIENRSFPSVFQIWNDVVGLDHLTWGQRNVLHDLYVGHPRFELHWDMTLAEPTYGVATQRAGHLERAREIRQRRLAQNPNMIFLPDIRYYHHDTPEAFPPDSDFWLRDAQGQILRNEANEYLIDFMKPKVQKLVIKRIIAVERCGLYDGVFLDGFLRNGTGFWGREHHHATDEEIIQVWINIFRAVRSQVRDDFLIIINANRTKATRYTEYVNGTFMETTSDKLGGNPGGYTRDGLYEIESTLTWSEQNFRSPQINCLEGWGIPTEPPDSPNNRRWMRVFTTMSLTHSDGYVMYNTGTGAIPGPDPDAIYPWGPGHEHFWYPFWDANLGRPIGLKAQLYKDIPGLFIREFTNGWAVYNRSGSTQEISLAENATGVASGQAGTTHRLADLDGEIYFTSKSFADVNGDGKVNILDLIQVTNSLGKSGPDPNGDGVVNILDLVFVAQQFGQ